MFPVIALVQLSASSRRNRVPPSAGARESVNAVKCTVNLRQIGFIWALYSEANNEELWVSDDATDPRPWGWWGPIVAHEKGYVDVLACPSMYQYGFFDSYEPGWFAANYPGDRRGGARIWAPKGVSSAYSGGQYWIDFGYGYNHGIQRAHGGNPAFYKLPDFKSPSRTGLQAETGSFYWHNRLDFAGYAPGTTGYWFSDRHKEGDHEVINGELITGQTGGGNVLFMDWHVDMVETPYPNPSIGSYNILNP